MKLVRPTSAPPTPAARPPRWRAVLAALATLVVGVLGAVGLAVPPAAAAEDLATWTRLSVSPRERAPAGTQIELVATVDPQLDPRVTGTVVFLDDGVPIGSADLAVDIDIIYASITYTPTTSGPHQLTAWYEGAPEASPSVSSPVTYDVLPETCPDQARPGAGAVVRHAYLVALRRCPDAAGFAYWVGRLDAGATAGVVAATLARSSEAIGVLVDDAYRTVLGREADSGGRAFWTARLARGWATSQLWAALASSPEFGAGIEGADGLVERAFTRIVGREVDRAGRNYWRDRLTAGAPPSSTWRALVLSAEVVRGVIDDAYQLALGRPATPTEVTAATAQVRGLGGSWRPLLGSILATTDAERHAQTYPDLPLSG